MTRLSAEKASLGPGGCAHSEDSLSELVSDVVNLSTKLNHFIKIFALILPPQGCLTGRVCILKSKLGEKYIFNFARAERPFISLK